MMLHHWLEANDADQVVPYLPTPEEIAARAAEIRRVNLINMRDHKTQDERPIELKICPRCRAYKAKSGFRAGRCNNCFKKRAAKCS